MAKSVIETPPYTLQEDFVGEKKWFFLYWVALLKNQHPDRQISTPELVEKLPISQQTISRRILDLEEQGYLTRNFEHREGYVEITAKGYVQLENVFENLQYLLGKEGFIEKFRGQLVTGMGEGGFYIRHPQYLEQFYKKVGFFPYFGTLNLKLEPGVHRMLLNHLQDYESVQIEGFTDESRTYGDVDCYRVLLWPCDQVHNQVEGAFLRIERTSHEPHILEFICEQYLRDYFGLKDGDEICFQFTKNHP